MTLTDWASLARDLFALVVVAIFAVPLFFLRREAPVVVAGLSGAFLVGFSGPFLNVNLAGGVALYVMSLALVIAMPSAVGRRARTGGAAAMASATFVPLALLALGYGVYLARSTGWWGLTTLGGDGSDVNGAPLIWLYFIGSSPFWAITAIVSGLVSRLISLRRQRAPPTPPAGLATRGD